MRMVLPRTPRVHSLTGRITLEALHKAFKAVKRHRGAAGLDKQSITMFAANLEANLVALMRDLKTGTYQPIPLRRVYMPQGAGKFRPLGIPAVRCRVAPKTHLTTFGQGLDFLGDHVTARTIRMGGKAEERVKMKIKALTRRSHNLDADVGMKVHRVSRGTVRYFATAFTTCLGQCNALDRWIRMRIRCMK